MLKTKDIVLLLFEFHNEIFEVPCEYKFLSNPKDCFPIHAFDRYRRFWYTIAHGRFIDCIGINKYTCIYWDDWEVDKYTSWEDRQDVLELCPNIKI